MITLDEVLNTTPFKYLRWGCRSGDYEPLLLGEAKPEDFPIVGRYDHLKTAPDNQSLGSCTCNAFTGLLEWWIYRTHGRAVQLDYDRLYVQLRELRGDMTDNGASLGEPYAAAKRYGWIPRDTGLIRVSPGVKAFTNALTLSPAVIAMTVHDGWAPARLHPENGAVAEDFASAVNRGENGHAILAVGTTILNGVPMVVIRNSWGGRGVMCCTWAHYLAWYLDRPLQILPGNDWAAWRGWERYVVREA